MPEAETEHLSQIATRWSLLVKAHQFEGDERHAAFAQLLPRYCRAIDRYLRRLVGDAAAEDLCQEFALKFLRGGFRHADPERGRFRDYLKTSVIHLAQAYRRGEARNLAVRELPSDIAVAGDDSDDGFRELWRKEMLNKTWAELEAADDKEFRVLRAKAESPDSTSAQLAEQFGDGLTAENFRQILHRARRRFAELLRSEVGATLPGAASEAIDDELAELGLLEYCR